MVIILDLKKLDENQKILRINYSIILTKMGWIQERDHRLAQWLQKLLDNLVSPQAILERLLQRWTRGGRTSWLRYHGVQRRQHRIWGVEERDAPWESRAVHREAIKAACRHLRGRCFEWSRRDQGYQTQQKHLSRLLLEQPEARLRHRVWPEESEDVQGLLREGEEGGQGQGIQLLGGIFRGSMDWGFKAWPRCAGEEGWEIWGILG